MKQRIEISWLTQNIDRTTGQMKAGFILQYKNSKGVFEQFEMIAKQKEIMDKFLIDDLTDLNWKMVDIDVEEKDGQKRIMGIFPVDQRVVTFADFERLESKVNQLITMLKKDPKAQP